MLSNEQVVLKIRRNPLFIIRGTIDLVIAGFFYNLYRSAVSSVPFWDDWRLVILYRTMMEDFFDQVFAVPASWIGWALLLVAVYFFFHAIRRYLHQFSTVYTFTNARVMKKTGILGVKTHELFLRSVDGVSRQQSLVGRLLGYGTLRIAGRGVDILEWHYVSDIDAVKEALEKRLLAKSTKPSDTSASAAKVPTSDSVINS